MIVYHFVPLRWGLENIQKQRLKVARLNDLNDPFEMMSPDAGDARFRRALNSARDVAHKRAGYLCFSAGWENPVQWSHYADGHKGICLAVEMPDHLLAPVRYSNKRLSMQAMDFDHAQPGASERMEQALFTKFLHWQYEREMRAVVDLTSSGLDCEGDLYFYPMGADCTLVGVILGHRCRLGRAQLFSLAGSWLKGVEIIKARAAFRSYRMVRQLDDSSWM